MRGAKSVVVVLAALCAALTAAVVWEWRHPPHPEDRAAPSGQEPPELPSAPSARLEIPPLSQYSAIVERPLFLSERRPPAEPQAVIEEAPGKESEFMLQGVLMTAERTIALLQIDATGKVARLAPGEMVKGWELESVRTDGVILRKDESVIDLPLVRNRSIPKPPTAAAPRPPARVPTAEELEAIRKATGAIPQIPAKEVIDNQ